MKLNVDQIDITLTPEQMAAVENGLRIIEEAMPFLTSVTTPQKRRLIKLGAKSRAFAHQALTVGKDNPGLMPSALMIEKLDRDVILYDQLATVRTRLERLTTRVSETQLLAGSDWMSGAMSIYRALRAHGEGTGLQDLIAELARRFTRKQPRESVSGAPEDVSAPM